ncbi:DUF2085 domain-containing protein [Candidatus Micrarchaeota archaeon]|nr:DUF2085 domain-containing protein [Candidatus Micrarchaeota archaeon]
MKIEHLVYAAYVGFFLVTMAVILAVPLLAFQHDMGTVYDAFGYTCHQKMSRSLCVFSDGAGYWIADCRQQNGVFLSAAMDRMTVEVQTDTALGYKMPVCSRDFGLYGAMLLGALVYPFLRKIEDKDIYPAIWLLVAIAPLALDGGIQLVSEIGLLPFVYESSNFLRLLTGAIAGIAASFYAIPLLMNMFGTSGGKKEKEKKK